MRRTNKIGGECAPPQQKVYLPFPGVDHRGEEEGCSKKRRLCVVKKGDGAVVALLGARRAALRAARWRGRTDTPIAAAPWSEEEGTPGNDDGATERRGVASGGTNRGSRREAARAV